MIIPVILGLAITGAVTQFSKITVGRPRPGLVNRYVPGSRHRIIEVAMVSRPPFSLYPNIRISRFNLRIVNRCHLYTDRPVDYDRWVA